MSDDPRIENFKERFGLPPTETHLTRILGEEGIPIMKPSEETFFMAKDPEVGHYKAMGLSPIQIRRLYDDSVPIIDPETFLVPDKPKTEYVDVNREGYGRSERGLGEYVYAGGIIHLRFRLPPHSKPRFKIKDGNTFILVDPDTGRRMDTVSLPYVVDRIPRPRFIKESGILEIFYSRLNRNHYG